MPIRLPGTGPDVEPRKARKWRIFWSYLPDWVLTIFLWVRACGLVRDHARDRRESRADHQGILYLVDKVCPERKAKKGSRADV